MDESARDLMDRFLALIDGVKEFTPKRMRKVWQLIVGHPWFLKQLESSAWQVHRYQRASVDDVRSFMQDVVVRLKGCVHADPTLNVDQDRIEETFESWMRTIIYFNCIDEKKDRVKKQRKEVAVVPLDVDVEEPQQDTSDLERRCALELAIRKLPREQRRALRLYVYEKKRIKDVAHIMGLTFGTARRRLDEARENVKRILREDGQL